MDLQTLQSEVSEWAGRNFPNALPYQPLLGATEEIGELAHAHLKNEQRIRGTPEEHFAAKKDAVADVVIYLCHYCRLNGFSIADAVDVAWTEVKRRDWIKNNKDGQVKE